MELFNENDKLASVIHRDHTLLPVINRLGIKLGFGDSTIKQLCLKEGIDVTFFIEIINVFHDESYFSRKKLLNFSVTVVIDYLLRTHHYYTDFVLPEQKRLIDLFLGDGRNGIKVNQLIRKFYNNYLTEFSNHIKNEENEVFPYILNLNEAINDQAVNPSLSQYMNFNIKTFEKSHSNLDEKMYDLQNIIIKYLPPNYDLNIGNSLISNLFLFEKDLKNHARIEDKILIPKVKELEKFISKNG